MMSTTPCPGRTRIISVLFGIGLFIALLFSHIVASAEVLRLGLPPYSNPSSVYASYAPLARYLGRVLGIQVHIVVSSSYADQINRVRNGEVDMAILGPTPYVEAQRDNPDIELLAKLDFESGFDQVVLITAARSPVTNVHSLHGRSFVFGDELSFGSHFLPRWILLKHGIHLNDLHKHAFLSNHDNVLLSVLHGDFDAGGVRLDIFNKFGDRSLRIIHGPIPIAPHVVVCRKSLDQGVRTRIRSALLELKNKKILAAISPEMQGFLPVEDGRFDLVRTIMQTVQTP